MKTSVLAPAVIVAAATATVGLGAASAAPAAAACPTPSVSINPSQHVAPNTLVEVTGHGFLCDVKGGFVWVTATYSGEPVAQRGNGPKVHLASDGSFRYDLKTFGPAGAKWTVTVEGGFSSVRTQATIILTGAGSAGTDPTAVPAGHVTVNARGSADAAWGIAALGGAGIALAGGGLTAGQRRRLARATQRSHG